MLDWLYDAFNRREWDRCLTAFASDAEWHEPDVPDAGVHRGRDEIRRWWEGLTSVVPGFHAEPQQFFEAPDQVVVATAISGAGRESGLDLGGQVGMVWTFREGRVVRCVVRRDLSDALDAADLSE